MANHKTSQFPRPCPWRGSSLRSFRASSLFVDAVAKQPGVGWLLERKLRAPFGVPFPRTLKEWSSFERALIQRLRSNGLSCGESRTFAVQARTRLDELGEKPVQASSFGSGVPPPRWQPNYYPIHLAAVLRHACKLAWVGLK